MIKKRFSKLAGVIFCLFAFCQIQAQVPLAAVNVQSPNAASLGLFGKIPVSLLQGKYDVVSALSYKLLQTYHKNFIFITQ